MTADDVWDGNGSAAKLARALLLPASWGYRAVVAGRNALFDAGVLKVLQPAQIVARRNTPGATAPRQVRRALALARRKLGRG